MGILTLNENNMNIISFFLIFFCYNFLLTFQFYQKTLDKNLENYIISRSFLKVMKFY